MKGLLWDKAYCKTVVQKIRCGVKEIVSSHVVPCFYMSKGETEYSYCYVN